MGSHLCSHKSQKNECANCSMHECVPLSVTCAFVPPLSGRLCAAAALCRSPLCLCSVLCLSLSAATNAVVCPSVCVSAGSPGSLSPPSTDPSGGSGGALPSSAAPASYTLTPMSTASPHITSHGHPPHPLPSIHCDTEFSTGQYNYTPCPPYTATQNSAQVSTTIPAALHTLRH